ncbi:hypothetical protein [Acinetobacter larvae]|uniref:Uncharacterized protein n=1 Tax=Acinetobacter larvae TaxID=1789224 RepID=A0A1B2M0Z1_9GAMM|nr:hypothetical protein [Acinetobacter larvae]AOA58848.1 hypothetical protein BFG52_11115 [Acinetobacter larvae]
MAHQKNNSVRILPSSAKKTAKPVVLYALLGFLGGILTICLIIFLYFYFDQETDQTQSSVKTPSKSHIEENDADRTAIRLNDSQAATEEQDYENQVDEQQLSSLFKPVPPTVAAKEPVKNHSSPFDTMLGQAPQTRSAQNTKNPETKPEHDRTKKIEKSVEKERPTTPVKPSSLDSLNIENELKSAQSNSSRAAMSKSD